MKKIHTHSTRGFIALMSAIIISSVLILMMVSVSTSSFFARADSSRGEYKRISLGLAESCTNAAILKTVENFNYDLTADPSYAPLPHNPAQSGVRIAVGGDECYITSLVLGAEDPLTHRKSATVNVQAEHNGAFSNVTTDFTVQNPDRGVAVAPPTCAIVASPTSLPVGKPLTLAWSSSPNASSITVQGGTLTSPVTLSPTSGGTYAIPSVASSPGTIVYTATVSNAGGSSQCTASVTVVPPPPAPDCADAVMMLDRSGSMFSNAADIPNEQAAATGLLNKYLDPLLALSPLPKVGVGRFGDAATGKSADIIAQLSNISNYASAFSAIANGLTNNSSWTNLADAIRKADVELNSTTRHTAGKKKGIILVSDGGTNQLATLFPTSGNAITDGTAAANTAKSGTMAAPSYKNADGIETQIFAIHFGSAGTGNADQNYLATLATNSANDHLSGTDTGYRQPSANAQNAAGDSWANAGGAYGAGAATATFSANKRHRYSSFGFPAIAVGTPIQDVTVQATAYLSYPTAQVAPTTVGNYDAWSVTGVATKPAAVAANDGSTSYISASTNGQVESFTVANAGVPANATVTSVEVHALAAKNSAGASNTNVALIVEKGAGGGTNISSDAPTGHTVSSSAYTDIQRTLVNNPFTGVAWTAAEVNSWPVKFGVARNSSSTGVPRVTQVYVVVVYTVPALGCKIGVDMSWDAGTNWSTEQSAELTSASTAYTFNTAGGWGAHTWAGSDFNTANFRVRAHSIDTNGTCGTAIANLDTLQAKVIYAGGTADAAAENSDGDHFFIAPTSADIPGLFSTIGTLLCPAAAPACSNTTDDDGDGLIDAADPNCTDPNDNDEWAAPPLPTPPVAPPTPTNINIGSWQEKPVLLAP